MALSLKSILIIGLV